MDEQQFLESPDFLGENTGDSYSFGRVVARRSRWGWMLGLGRTFKGEFNKIAKEGESYRTVKQKALWIKHHCHV